MCVLKYLFYNRLNFTYIIIFKKLRISKMLILTKSFYLRAYQPPTRRILEELMIIEKYSFNFYLNSYIENVEFLIFVRQHQNNQQTHDNKT